MLGAVVADPGAGNVERNSVRCILTLRLVIRCLLLKKLMGLVVPLSQDSIRMIIVVEGIIVIVRSGGKV